MIEKEEATANLECCNTDMDILDTEIFENEVVVKVKCSKCSLTKTLVYEFKNEEIIND